MKQMMGVTLALTGPGATICTSLQTDNYASTSSLTFYYRMLFLMPNCVKALKAIIFHTNCTRLGKSYYKTLTGTQMYLNQQYHFL